MGHAIRLFQMPQHFARFLDVLETAAARDVVLAQHFGGRVRREPALERWTRMVERGRGRRCRPMGRGWCWSPRRSRSGWNEASRSAASFSKARGPHNRIAEIVLNRAVDGRQTARMPAGD